MKKLFPSLPANGGLTDVFQAFPDTIAPLLDYHDRLLRGDSPLSEGERELIAAFVSGLNACSFCFGAHAIYAKAFGLDPGLLDQLLEDFDAAPIEPRLKPILAYVAKLTKTPAMMTEDDAQAVYDAGWSERALFDAIQTCALFNFMNRIIEGTGVETYPQSVDSVTETDLEIRRTRTYTQFGQSIGVVPSD